MSLPEPQQGMYGVSGLQRDTQHDNLTLTLQSLPRVYPSEFIIVTIVLLAWLCAIGVFVNKWAKIQIVEPPDHRNHAINPMNLHTIKVVKKARDSVIYHNYSASHKRSLRDRQDRLARMQQNLPLMSPPACDVTSGAMAAEQKV